MFDFDCESNTSVVDDYLSRYKSIKTASKEEKKFTTRHFTEEQLEVRDRRIRWYAYCVENNLPMFEQIPSTFGLKLRKTANVRLIAKRCRRRCKTGNV